MRAFMQLRRGCAPGAASQLQTWLCQYACREIQYRQHDPELLTHQRAVTPLHELYIQAVFATDLDVRAGCSMGGSLARALLKPSRTHHRGQRYGQTLCNIQMHPSGAIVCSTKGGSHASLHQLAVPFAPLWSLWSHLGDGAGHASKNLKRHK
jgi:hypothetical protein